MTLPSRKCLTCGEVLSQAGNADEHVVPRWLLKHLGIQHDDLERCLAETETRTTKARRQQVCDSYKQGLICAGCNHGWMHDLEDIAAPLMKPMCDGRRSVLSIGNEEAFHLSRWVIKTALLTASVTVEKPAADLSDLGFIRENPTLLPDGWGVFAAMQPAKQRQFSYFDRAYWLQYPSAPGRPHEVRALQEAVKISFQFGHLMVKAAKLPVLPCRFLIPAGFHVPLLVWPPGDLQICYRTPILAEDPLDPLQWLEIFNDSLAIVHQGE